MTIATSSKIIHITDLTIEEKIAYDWQYNSLGHFGHNLMEAISHADSYHIELLRRVFPEYVGAYEKYSNERGWFENIIKKRNKIVEKLKEVRQ